MTTVAVSGGFDPIHIGHIRLIEDAAKYGDVMVILNSDRWLLEKKGFVFMKAIERTEILLSIRNVKSVVSVHDEDGTVCEALRLYKPDYFANGGDRTLQNSTSPEGELCEKLGIKRLYGIGGGKIQSSSQLVKEAKNEHSNKR
jgi:cytidyltransferase-like protein